MNKLQAILDRCKCGVFLTVNEHRDYYEPAGDFLVGRDETLPTKQPELFARMVELDTVICLQFYPDTPVGCYVIWHHDIDAALDEGLRALGIAAPVQAPAVGAEPSGEVRELLDLIVKSGRRCAYDLKHAVDSLIACRAPDAELFKGRPEHWLAVFDPADGPKDYRARLHIEIAQLERRLREAEEHIEELSKPPVQGTP